MKVFPPYNIRVFKQPLNISYQIYVHKDFTLNLYLSKYFLLMKFRPGAGLAHILL